MIIKHRLFPPFLWMYHVALVVVICMNISNSFVIEKTLAVRLTEVTCSPSLFFFVFFLFNKNGHYRHISPFSVAAAALGVVLVMF